MWEEFFIRAGGESTVRTFVQKEKKQHIEMFMPLTADGGEQAQVDWSRAKVYIQDKLTIPSAKGAIQMAMEAASITIHTWIEYPNPYWLPVQENRFNRFFWITVKTLMTQKVPC